MKVLSPRRFKLWLVAVATIAAIAMVLVAPVNRPHAQSPAYTIIDLGTLGGLESKAFGINSCGQIAGYATLAGGSKQPFFRPANSLINLGVPSGDGTATSVNSLGYVVGNSPLNANQRAFIWHDDNNDGDYSDAGERKELLPAGRVGGSADDINDNGRVVGWLLTDGDSGSTGGFESFTWENNNYQIITGSSPPSSPLAHGINNAGSIVGENSDFPQHAWILRSGVFTYIGVFAPADVGKSVAYAVSEAGHVVGTAEIIDGGDTHAFIWTDTGINPGLKDLGTLSGLTRSVAYDIAVVNSRLHVVGTSYTGLDPDASGAKAFVWQDDNNDGDSDSGELRNLNDLIPPADQANWTLHHARSINSAGQIVGYGTIGGQKHAFLMTPTNFTSACVPGVSVAVSPSSVAEDGATDLTYTFTRSAVTSSPLTVNFTASGTTDSSDYSISHAGSVTILANQATATVTVNPATDLGFEPNETVILTIAANAAYAIGTPSAATGTINNDDAALPTVTLSSSPSAVAEDGATNLVYTFNRTGPNTSPLTVNFSVGGTATFNTDYTQSGAASFTPPTGSVTFTAGNSQATVTIDPTTDSTVEANETVDLALTANAAYTIGNPNSASGTITNDDTDVIVALSPLTVTESGAPNLVYTFTRTGVTTGPLTVNFSVSGTATLTSDYTQSGATTFSPPNGTVTIGAGNTSANVTIDPVADSTLEGDETVTLTLATGAGYNVATPSAATGTITPDAPVIFTEEGNGSFAFAVDSVIFARGPFRLIDNNRNFSADKQTRIILVTSPLGMTNADLATGILSVRIAGYANPLPIEHVGPLTGVTGLSASYIIVKLPTDLPNPVPGPNNLTLTIKMGSAESNSTILSIVP